MAAPNPTREVSLAEWARHNGMNLRTAQRMFHRGEIEHPTWVTDTGRLMVRVPADTFAKSNRPDASQRQLDRIERKLDEVLALLRQG